MVQRAFRVFEGSKGLGFRGFVVHGVCSGAFVGSIVNPRKLEHGFRMISAGIPYTLPLGQEENDVPSFWLLLYTGCFNDSTYEGSSRGFKI